MQITIRTSTRRSGKRVLIMVCILWSLTGSTCLSSIVRHACHNRQLKRRPSCNWPRFYYDQQSSRNCREWSCRQDWKQTTFEIGQDDTANISANESLDHNHVQHNSDSHSPVRFFPRRSRPGDHVQELFLTNLQSRHMTPTCAVLS